MPTAQQALIEVQGLCKTYCQRSGWQRPFRVRALDRVDLVLKAGSTLALVGDSGSGKTTLAMCMVGIEQPDAGCIRFEGKDLCSLSKTESVSARRNIQLVFQDSTGCLNPRMAAATIIEEPLLIRGRWSREERSELVARAMEQVDFSCALKDRRPDELSGGQRQRLAIARALVLKPKLLILDEALAGLDLSIQGQITNLLLDLQTAHGLSYLYISHNLDLISCIADEVAIIHQGTIVEQGRTSEVLANSHHRYFQGLRPRAATPTLTVIAHSGV